MHTQIFKANLITSFSCYINLPLGMNILYWLTAKQIYHLPFIKDFSICLEKTFKEPSKKYYILCSVCIWKQVQIISMTFLWQKREVRSLSQETFILLPQLHSINGIKSRRKNFYKTDASLT